jgi:alpha-N-arabinofuranosidase
VLGVGNEQWGDQYIARWKIFTKAIKDKYPYIKIVSSVGPSPDGEEFNRLDKFFRSNNADILDEHYYKAPKWFLDNALNVTIITTVKALRYSRASTLRKVRYP